MGKNATETMLEEAQPRPTIVARVDSLKPPRDPRDVKIPRKVKLLEDRILVRRDAPVKEIRGFLVPEAHQEAAMEGTVVAVGPGREGKPLKVQVGDRVLISRYAGNEMKFSPTDEESHVVLREDELLLVFA